MTRNLFITFEGPEGSGKSTQINKLCEYLKSKGADVLITREPGGTFAGDRIRSILIDKSSGDLEPETELFLMAAQRNEHFKKVIKPALDKGKVVLCDRYFDSSMAYQGYARKIGMERVKKLHDEFLQDYLPSSTILLSISPETGLNRVKERAQKNPDRIESESQDFHLMVSEAYEKLAKIYPERFIKIIADNKTPDDIFEEILKAINEKYGKLP
ncbi:MAG: dTMP kinase [Candidatus Riflebacteria bacterium]|nr:dTMP kinase [Candidatus Riflebacteria bacterium]